MFRTLNLVLCLSMTLSSACARITRWPRAPTAGAPHLKVMTYNVNFGIPGDAATVAAIREADADLVFLQETTAEWEQSLRARLSDPYPYVAYRHCCGAGGLAVLSKFPFTDANYLEAPAGGWFPAWRVIVDSPLGPLQVLNVHLHPPVSETGSFVSGYISTPPVRVRELKSHLEALDPALPTLVVGDFNEDRKGRAMDLLRRRGLTNALPEFAPDRTTWRWNTSVGRLTQQLDHIAYSAHLLPASVEVLEAGNSDHLPVVAVFERPALAPSRSGTERVQREEATQSFLNQGSLEAGGPAEFSRN